MKQCVKCQIEKPSSEFRGNRNDCRLCENAYCRSYHVKNKAKRNQQQKDWRELNSEYVKVKDQERYDRARAFIDAAKSKPCADCRQLFPSCVMDFDHVRGTKSFQIAASLKRYKIETVQREMDKCDLVCANCHRIRTHITRRTE